MQKLFLMLIFILYTALLGGELQKAKLFDYSQNIDNWLMSEKLDGIRAFWDGKELKTRQGKTIYAPRWFTQNFPPFELDGELWTKRMDFENIQSIVLSQHKNDEWKRLSYNIFEAPYAEGDFVMRLKKVQQWFLEHQNPYVKIIPQKLCKNTQELEEFLNDIIAHQGEGVMLKNPNTFYEEGLSNSLLKVKKFYDTEGIVIGHNYNHNKQLKSLIIKLPNGVVFNLGNGFSQEQRQNPPKIGSIITFKYYGLTKNNKPKFASFLHERKD
ncbi:MAG: DNA ligase [Arcobacteraceae bacterium]|nr:DNA ligase [Arcobacteraceae bacterium]